MLCCQFVFSVSLNLCQVAGNFYLVAVLIVGFYAVNHHRYVSGYPCARTVEIIVLAITVNLKAAIDNYQRIVYLYLNRERTLVVLDVFYYRICYCFVYCFILCNALIFDYSTNVI